MLALGEIATLSSKIKWHIKAWAWFWWAFIFFLDLGFCKGVKCLEYDCNPMLSSMCAIQTCTIGQFLFLAWVQCDDTMIEHLN